MANKRLLCIDDQEDTCALVSSILSDYEVVLITICPTERAWNCAGSCERLILTLQSF